MEPQADGPREERPLFGATADEPVSVELFVVSDSSASFHSCASAGRRAGFCETL